MKAINFAASLLRRKALPKKDGTAGLKRTLNLLDLIGFGVGGVIGAGIFVLTGVAAKNAAGPAIVISFIIDAIACILSGLCYAEFAASVPFTGSAYLYCYVTMGELPAFFIGWALILEYVFATAAVSRGWSGYLASIVSGFGGKLPEIVISIDAVDGVFDINVMAAVVVLLLTIYSYFGIKNSSYFNWAITGFSVLAVLFVVCYGSYFIDTSNWNNFMPYGFSGIFKGAGIVFFAYIGFDMLANYSEEAINPHRDMPLSIVASLLICGALYVSVSLVITGMVPLNEIDVNAPLSVAFRKVGSVWAEIIISLGAFAALLSSMLVSLTGAPRIVYSMARDGLLPQWLLKLTRREEPFVAQLTCSTIMVLFSLLLDIEQLSELVSIGTLAAFTFVNAAVLARRNENSRSNNKFLLTILIYFYVACIFAVGVTARFTSDITAIIPIIGLIAISGGLIFFYFYRYVDPVEVAHFQTPLVPLVPMLGILVNVYLMCSLLWLTWVAAAVWFTIGFVIYFGYSYRNSYVGLAEEEDSPLYSLKGQSVLRL